MVVFWIRSMVHACPSNYHHISWWRHVMETFSALLAICAENSPVRGEFPIQRPVMRSFDVFFDLRLNKWLSKQSWGWWFETPSRPLWRHRNVIDSYFEICAWIENETNYRKVAYNAQHRRTVADKKCIRLKSACMLIYIQIPCLYRCTLFTKWIRKSQVIDMRPIHRQNYRAFSL